MDTAESHVADVILKALHAHGGSMASFEVKALGISRHMDVFLLSKTLQQLIDLNFIRKGTGDNTKGRHLLYLTQEGEQAAVMSLLAFLASREQQAGQG